jgi:hypothetical protein
VSEVKKTFSTLDSQKRETLRKLLRGTAYAIPVIASFSMNAVDARPPCPSAFPNCTIFNP